MSYPCIGVRSGEVRSSEVDPSSKSITTTHMGILSNKSQAPSISWYVS